MWQFCDTHAVITPRRNLKSIGHRAMSPSYILNDFLQQWQNTKRNEQHARTTRRNLEEDFGVLQKATSAEERKHFRPQRCEFHCFSCLAIFVILSIYLSFIIAYQDCFTAVSITMKAVSSYEAVPWRFKGSELIIIRHSQTSLRHTACAS